MNVCADCARFGKVVARKAAPKKEEMKAVAQRQRRIEKAPEIVESVIPEFYKKIRQKREQMGLKQEDFSKMLSIKESMLHKMEIGEFIPAIALAKRIEHILEIKIVEQVEEKPEHAAALRKADEAMTIGDMVKIREKK